MDSFPHKRSNLQVLRYSTPRTHEHLSTLVPSKPSWIKCKRPSDPWVFPGEETSWSFGHPNNAVLLQAMRTTHWCKMGCRSAHGSKLLHSWRVLAICLSIFFCVYLFQWTRGESFQLFTVNQAMLS